MPCKFLEISLGQNVLPRWFEIVEVVKNTFVLKSKDSHVGLLGTLKKLLKSNGSMGESLFIGSTSKLIQWSVSQKKLTKDYGGIMAGYNFSMVQTTDKNYLFLSDNKGC